MPDFVWTDSDMKWSWPARRGNIRDVSPFLGWSWTEDWADPDAIIDEWRAQTDPPDWGNAMEMYEHGVPPAQLVNVAEYICRVLKLDLLEPGVLDDRTALVASSRVLSLLAEPPEHPEIAVDMYRQFAPRLIRLALAVVRSHRWQPGHFGGDGTCPVQLQIPAFNYAVATTRASTNDYLGHFFSHAIPRGSPATSLDLGPQHCR